MTEINITVNVNVQGEYDSGGRGSADAFSMPATLLYFFGFIGMAIMLFNVPSYLLVLGILGLVLYTLPLIAAIIAAIMKPFALKREREYERELEQKLGKNLIVTERKNLSFGPFDEEDEPFTVHLCHMLYDGGSVIGNVFKRFIAPYAFCLFNLMLAIFWICYPLGSINEIALISMIIPSAYSMYYFPFVLIRAAVRLHSKLLGFVTAGIITASLALFLINYNTFMEIDSVVGIAFFFTMITVLSTLAILLTNLVLSKSKKTKQIILLLLYVVLLIAVTVVSVVALPDQNEDKYNEAIACVARGDYRQARVLFLELGRYQDAEQRYQEIQFTDLQVGEQVIMGSQFNKPGSTDGDNPLSWTVISVKDGQALLLSDAILTSIESNSLSQWNKSNSVRSALRNLSYLFSDAEKERIVEYSYSFTADGEEIEASDKLFLLSQKELEQYCSDEQIFSKKDSKYNDHQVLNYLMQDSDYEYVYSYYVRGTDSSGEWIIADCQSKQFSVKDNRYVGIRPAMYISMEQEKSQETDKTTAVSTAADTSGLRYNNVQACEADRQTVSVMCEANPKQILVPCPDSFGDRIKVGKL